MTTPVTRRARVERKNQGVRHRGRTRSRRDRPGRHQHRRPVLRPHADVPGHPCQFRSDRARQGRRRDRGAPHGRGHCNRVGAGPRPKPSATRRASAGSEMRSSPWTRRWRTPSVDVSGRPYCVHTGEPDYLLHSTIAGSSVPYHTVINRHVFESLAMNARIALHVRTLYGRDPHHITEAQFKAVARALRQAVEPDPRVSGVPSTKGSL